MSIKKLISQLISFALVILSVSPCFGYGREAIAPSDSWRSNASTTKQPKAVNALLKNDKCKDLACVAPWPDDLKQAIRNNLGPLAGDKEAKAFQKAFPNNDKWHFVNLPLGSEGYEDNGPFSKSFDIVHTINLCVSVLEGKSKQFTKLQAYDASSTTPAKLRGSKLSVSCHAQLTRPFKAGHFTW